MLTKGSFTRDEWNHLLHLLNIMNFWTSSRSHFFRSKQKAECLWCRKGLKKVFHTIRQRWRRNQERWVLCRIETCLFKGRVLQKRMILNSRGVTDQIRCSPASVNSRNIAQIVCLSLHSQERPQGITSRIGSEHSDENGKFLWLRETGAGNTDTRKQNQTRIS